MVDSVTAVIANHVAGARWDDLPGDLAHEAKRALLNHFAAALAGCRDETVEKLLAVLSPFSCRSGASTNAASIIGRAEQLGQLDR